MPPRRPSAARKIISRPRNLREPAWPHWRPSATPRRRLATPTPVANTPRPQRALRAEQRWNWTKSPAASWSLAKSKACFFAIVAGVRRPVSPSAATPAIYLTVASRYWRMARRPRWTKCAYGSPAGRRRHGWMRFGTCRRAMPRPSWKDLASFKARLSLEAPSPLPALHYQRRVGVAADAAAVVNDEEDDVRPVVILDP